MSRLSTIAGDLTALVMTASSAHRTAEDIHAEVVRIMAKHPEAIATPDRERIAAWCRVVVLPPLPEIADPAMRSALEQCAEDIRNRINLLATETKENA